jgi:hypothetical protein
MFIKPFSFLILVSLLLFTSSCFPSSISNLHFTGDGSNLLIQENELPSGWKLEETRNNPIKDAHNWTVVYNITPDAFGTASEIGHAVTVFEREEDAKRFLEAMHQTQKKLVTENATLVGSPQEEFTPPQKYSYKSPTADQFNVIYSPERDLTGVVIGYRYEVLARYGNVVSWFVAIMEDGEEKSVEVGETSLLSWREMEKLLKLIDEKFQQANRDNSTN